MAADPQHIAQLLQATSDPRHLKQAEAALKLEEAKPGFSLLLLNIVASESLPLNTRISSALYFKNFVRFNYVDEEGNYKLPESEVTTIKQELIGLMIRVPPSIQAQLGEAISLIADSDFWVRWDTLVDDLVSRLTPDNAKVNIGVLEVAHSIFRRWRPLFRSDELYTEINHVLKTFQAPFLELLTSTDAQIEANKANKEVLKQHMLTMDLLIKLFYDLSCQDLPPMFEDSLQPIAALFSKYLTYENALLSTDDDSEVGVLERVRTGICEALVLYVQKYEDAFGQYVQPFITTIWNLLTTIGPETKYDLLVSKGLQFLTAVSGITQHAEAFNNDSVLEQVVENAILPSVRLRESDIEQFEDSPIEYIRSNLEGTDIDTRRRAATEFLRTLLRQYETLVTKVVEKYITYYLTKYAQNPREEWQSKNAAVYLYTAIAAQGVVTASQGVRTVNKNLNVVEFFQSNIASDLVDDSAAHPILKVDAINYLYIFRSQLTKEQWQGAFQPLVQNLLSSNYVVYTYASIAVERVLSLTDTSGTHVFGKEDVQPFAKDLLGHLFQLVEKEPAPEKIQENEFLMRCVMRVLIVIKEAVVPIADLVLEHLIQITKIISANPSNPRFYYYHFEAMGALIRYDAPAQSERLEVALYEPFAYILQNDVEEFKPYVFQLFAALLEANPSGVLSEYYKGLIGPILMPDLWVSRGNVPALARLLCAIIPRGAADIKANNQIEAILGVFQNLVSKTTKSRLEVYAFDILETVVQSFTGNDLAKYFPVILQIIYGRINDSTPEYFKLRLVRFYHLVSARDEVERGYGTDYFIAASDSIQDGAFVPLYLRIILPTTQLFAKPLDRKIAAISLTKTLTDSQKFAVRYVKGWAMTCETLVKLVENAPVITTDDVVVVEQDVDDSAFGVGFTQLSTCKRQPHDSYPQVTDIKTWMKTYFTAADNRAAADAKPSQWLRERATPEVAQAFVSYLGL
ncbi:MAG: importin-alpha export receptor [Claussenomyces sp. TS43310]|nr:MAG: importin-alpha export receptor [Claussenomyces sp. TS43310]